MQIHVFLFYFTYFCGGSAGLNASTVNYNYTSFEVCFFKCLMVNQNKVIYKRLNKLNVIDNTCY